MKKVNKLLKVLCLSLGVASLMGIASIPIYAIPTGYTQEEWDAKQKAEQEAVTDLPHDVLLPSEKPKIPQGGDVQNLNVSWSNTETGIYYCKDESRVKVTDWQQINGKWYYFDPTSYEMKDGWLNDGGDWYYCLEPTHINEKYLSLKKGLLGTMQTGWFRDNDKIYYLNQNGIMQTGWVLDNGKWHYFNQDGTMVVNTTIDGCNIGADGAWI